MGLRFSWSIFFAPPCCGNCIFVEETKKTFSCKLGTHIHENHFTKLNITLCNKHRYLKKLQKKHRNFKKKSAKFIKFQDIKL